MAHHFRSLFTPVRVGAVTLGNRIYSSAHAEAMAEGGRPTERLRRYHEAKARGGCALTIFGGSTSVHPSSPAAAWRQIANHDDSIIAAYREMARAVHAHDCLIFTQLTHLGRRAQSDTEGSHALLAPSQIPEAVHREVPHEIEPEQIADLVRAFGAAARRCREGGLDGIEISMAHNHLIDQFWSPLFNRRTDEYGGSLENRMRFGFEVLAEIRRQVGSDFVVGARISGDEFTPGGLTAHDMAEITQSLTRGGICPRIGGTMPIPARLEESRDAIGGRPHGHRQGRRKLAWRHRRAPCEPPAGQRLQHGRIPALHDSARPAVVTAKAEASQHPGQQRRTHEYAGGARLRTYPADRQAVRRLHDHPGHPGGGVCDQPLPHRTASDVAGGGKTRCRLELDPPGPRLEHLDPGVGVGVAHFIVAREHVVRSGRIPSHQSRRNPGSAQQHRQRAGKRLTRSLAGDKQKLVHGIGMIR